LLDQKLVDSKCIQFVFCNCDLPYYISLFLHDIPFLTQSILPLDFRQARQEPAGIITARSITFCRVELIY
jgi:hypothetical protein